MKKLKRFRMFLVALSCIAVSLCACVFSMGSLARLAMDSTPAPTPSLLPADHGLPDTIAGYRVLAVTTSETTRCKAPGTISITIQIESPAVEEALQTDWRAVLDELERLLPDSRGRWDVSIIGPGTTFEEIVAGNDRWNSMFAEHDCLRLGGPILGPGETPVIIPAEATPVP